MKNIKFYRKKAGFSQQELAEKCDIATNYVSEIETGKKFPSVEMIETLANALGTPAYLFFLQATDIDIDTELVQKNRNEDFAKTLLRTVNALLKEYHFII